MGKFVEPKVYVVGHTVVNWDGMRDYLSDTGNLAFEDAANEADSAVSDAEILTSFNAKLCYKSLSVGHNSNVTRVRDIADNLRATHEQGHGSVWEHASVNFVATDVSRVLTHELVRHRVGTAFSQTSGRYVRGDSIDVVFDPILEPVREDAEELLAIIEDRYRRMVAKMGLDAAADFDFKKKATSALRRFLPNGQPNEIGFTCNFRALRHIVQVRTSRHAEREIRDVFGQVYRLTKGMFPLLYHGAREETVNGLVEVSGMKT